MNISHMNPAPIPLNAEQDKARKEPLGQLLLKMGKLNADEIERLVMARPKVQANLDGLSVVKVVHVPGRLVNIVVR